MKSRVILIGFLCVSNFVFAQTSRIQQLENELVSASGQARALKFIELSDANFEAGLYDQALDRAEEAVEFSKKNRMPALRAMALNREAKALMKLEKKGLFGKNKAVPKFQQSNEILRESRINDPKLMLENLQHLKTMAEKAGKSAEMAALESEMARVNREGVFSGGDAPNSKSELKQEVSKLEAEKAALDQKLQQQLAAQLNASKKSDELARQSAALQSQLAEKEAAISQMTEEQMKSELVLMQQRSLLDSLTFKSSLDSINLLNKELSLREANSSRNFSLAAAVALMLLLGGSTFSFFRARKHAREIEAEKKRSEDLLLNILPALVAKELKKQGYSDPQYHEDVAVLFADFVGFSKIAEILSPGELIRELDTCFKAFDEIIQKYKLEKIKTVGDCYMVASGLEENRAENEHLYNMVKAAKEMQNWLLVWNAERQKKNLPRFDARIGIHAGPVVAGVVGSKKFAFDIWGDTVNIAARIEQAGESGKINISGKAYEAIKDAFNCKFRGEIEAKNKGKIAMYFVEN